MFLLIYSLYFLGGTTVRVCVKQLNELGQLSQRKSCRKGETKYQDLYRTSTLWKIDDISDAALPKIVKIGVHSFSA